MKPGKLYSQTLTGSRGTFSLKPAQFLAISFAITIALGAVLLSLPVARAENIDVSLLDALFTATAAVCLAGLAVVDTSQTWSPFGQLVILVLMQVGGLGVMTMSMLVVLALRRKVTLRERLIIQESFSEINIAGMVRLIRQVVSITLFLEVVGALLLAWRWSHDFGWRDGLWLGFFHSVSAFNNAGLDLFSVSMVPYVGDWSINLIIPGLSILGGLGIIVLRDLLAWRFRRPHRLSLHTKIVLATSAGLLVWGFLMILILEWSNPLTLGQHPLSTKLLAAWFHSVAPRSSGFSTLPIDGMEDATLFLTMMLMFVGASPGSTGGGVKTTAFAAVISAVIATVRGQSDIEMFGRRITRWAVMRSLSIIIISLTAISIMTLLLAMTEEQPFISLLFEVFSAFGTVGLSTGITPELTPVGKLILIAAMYVGRLGPLTLAVAMVQNKHRSIRLPEEKISVG